MYTIIIIIISNNNINDDYCFQPLKCMYNNIIFFLHCLLTIQASSFNNINYAFVHFGGLYRLPISAANLQPISMYQLYSL